MACIAYAGGIDLKKITHGEKNLLLPKNGIFADFLTLKNHNLVNDFFQIDYTSVRYAGHDALQLSNRNL